MQFYEQYPIMRPFVGDRFYTSTKPKLLLIGESHYLDEDTPQRNPASWYQGSSSSLSEYDAGFVHTKQLFIDSREDGFSNKAHSIWSNPLWVINKNGPRYADYTEVADDIAFYNFFLRPAIDGASLESETCEMDLALANEAFAFHFASLKPTAIVFLSQFAHSCFNHTIDVPVIATPHPGPAWWNRVAQSYGNKRGQDILADFIKTLNWTSSPPQG